MGLDVGDSCDVSCSEVHIQMLLSLGTKIRESTSSKVPTKPKLF